MSKENETVYLSFTALVEKSKSASTGTYIDEAEALAKRYYQPILGPSYQVYGRGYMLLLDEDDAIDGRLLMIVVSVEARKID